MSSVTGSFISKAKENVQTANSNDFDDVGMTQVQFGYNDIQNGYIQYTLQTKEELLYNALNSLNSNDMKEYYMNAQLFNKGTNTGILGLKYSSLLDMSKSKFSVNIANTNATNVAIFNLYLFFNGVLQI